ncbi:Uncharacterised protein [Vibrio cholerae]|nr:Uncharacterised protein [Vibrio cholerae]CSI94711.1 Uncharacterised protein [Vibrio cholerae]
MNIFKDKQYDQTNDSNRPRPNQPNRCRGRSE